MKRATEDIRPASSSRLAPASCVGDNEQKRSRPVFCSLETFSPTARRIGRGTVLFRPGDVLDRIYQIRSGWVKLSRASRCGRDLVVELLFPGDFFDLHCLLQAGPTSFTASSLASQPCELRSFNRSSLQAATQAPQLASKLLEQMRRQHDMMLAIAHETVEMRIVMAIEHIYSRVGWQEGSQMLVPMLLNRQELGELTATSGETVIRTLTNFQRRELLEWRGDTIVCSAELFALRQGL